MEKEFILKVGEKKDISLGLLSSATIVYCGMPAPEVFSIAHKEHSGYQGFGYNLFFEKGTKDIHVDGAEFRVIDVNKQSIRLIQVKK